MSDQKITELPVATSLNLADLIAIVQGGASKSSTLTRMKALILEAVTIGGAAAGDITTNNAVQTMLNKIFTACRSNSPKFNEDVALTMTSTILNKLAGHLAGTGDNHPATTIVYGDSTVGDTLDALASSVAQMVASAVYYLPKFYSLKWTQSGTEKDIKESDILTALNITGYVVLPSIKPSLAISDGSKYAPLNLATYCTWTETVVDGQTRLEAIVLGGLTNGLVYDINVVCRLVQEVPAGI